MGSVKQCTSLFTAIKRHDLLYRLFGHAAKPLKCQTIHCHHAFFLFWPYFADKGHGSILTFSYEYVWHKNNIQYFQLPLLHMRWYFRYYYYIIFSIRGLLMAYFIPPSSQMFYCFHYFSWWYYCRDIEIFIFESIHILIHAFIRLRAIRRQVLRHAS